MSLMFRKTKEYLNPLKQVRPSTLQALKIGEIAKRIDFDWATPAEVLAQFNSEVDELNQEYNKSSAVTDGMKLVTFYVITVL